MLKIPSFILGGLLILTGIVGYLAQDQSLSIKLSGAWASDAEFVLSDGEQKHTMDFIPCDTSAGENVWWIVHKLNDTHAKEISMENYKVSSGTSDRPIKSYWYASASGDTFSGLFEESDNYHNAGSGTFEAVAWNEIDPEEAKLRLIYNNAAGTSGPVTLSSNNWENVVNAPANGESLEFGKSWTAFIPSIIGLILILCAVAADQAPNARKHIMHVAVLIGLLGFLSVAGKAATAFSEMGWWRNEPYNIVGASSLKPTTMLLTAGLLLIYVILCVVSFITARKEMAAQAALEAARKEAEEEKTANQPAESAHNSPDSSIDSNSGTASAAPAETPAPTEETPPLAQEGNPPPSQQG